MNKEKLLMVLTIVNTLAILFLCVNAYLQIDERGHLWDMFQDFEKLKEFINNNKLDTVLLNDMVIHGRFSWFKMVRIACTKANIEHVYEAVEILKQKK